MKTIKRRRTENKTDYSKRIKILGGGFPRVVFRKTNKYFIAQYVSSNEAQDKIEIGLTSKQLLKYGWPKSAESGLKALPAAYLLGLLIGKEIIKGKKATPIIDLGMLRTLHKTNIYAFIKGVSDSGVKIKTKKETFPSEDRIKGDHLKNKIPFAEIKSKIEKL